MESNTKTDSFLINDEQKIRFALSTKAKIIIAEDMDIFKVSKTTTFINTVFDNYKSEAKSSIFQYLQQIKDTLNNKIPVNNEYDKDIKAKAINMLIEFKKKELLQNNPYLPPTDNASKLYRINNVNKKYLTNECNEYPYYKRPGKYIRSVIEEYCSLPFIERERIYKKDIYDTVQSACEEKHILKIAANYYGTEQLFYVYPYKIVPDSLHTQSYLVCYSRRIEQEEKDKIIASFSMAKLSKLTKVNEKFYLNKSETDDIENIIAKQSPAYLVGNHEHIKIKLTEKGKQSYHTRLYSRPLPINIEQSSNYYIYTFDCSQQQIYNYFFPFGADAEALSPEYLRNRFINAHMDALKQYTDSNPNP